MGIISAAKEIKTNCKNWKKKKKRVLISFALGGLVVLFWNSPVVHWLRLQAPRAGGMGLIPGQGAKITHATWYSPKERQTETGWGQS